MPHEMKTSRSHPARQRRAAYLGMISVLCWMGGMSLGGGGGSPVEAHPPATKGIQPAEVPAPAGGPPAPALPLTSPGPIQGRDGDEMVPVPAGEFWMGSPDGEGGNDEHPRHRVYLEAFSMDRLEVTNARYRGCVEAGKCTPPADRQEYDDRRRADHPVVNVGWEQANAYCGWAGKRLPTEAEWEKAARGTDGRVYPWGNDFDPRRANLTGSEDGYEGTAPVGSFPSGASPYGVMDMAGNAWEWVNDWYDEGYYAHSPSRNLRGPDSGQSRVLRGGSWRYRRHGARAVGRDWVGPNYRCDGCGFRCVQDAR